MVVRKRDADRADLGAAPAERAGIGKIPICRHSPEKRGKHASHGTGVDGFVGVTPNGPVDRAYVKAGAAVKAVQDFSKRSTRQSGPAIVEEHHVQFFRAFLLSRPSRTRYEVDVARNRLARGRSGEQGEKSVEVRQVRDDLVDSHDRHMHGRETRGHPAVAFIGHEHKGAGFRHTEIHTGDAEIGTEEAFSECLPCSGYQVFHIEPRRCSKSFMKKPVHLESILVD